MAAHRAKKLFVGSVEALSKELNIGDTLIPEYSVCGVGANRYLTDNRFDEYETFGKKYFPNVEYNNKLKAVVESFGAKMHIGKIYNSDSVFAEYTHIDEIKSMGCDSIKMETATFFHAAEVAGLKATALLYVSDNTFNGKSLFVGRSEKDHFLKEKVKTGIIPKIILKTFGIRK